MKDMIRVKDTEKSKLKYILFLIDMFFLPVFHKAFL